MPSFRFVHAADLHLDTPFEGVGQLGDGVRERLRDTSLEAFDNLVTLTLEKEASFLVLAGDIYDGAERGIRAQLRVLNGLRQLHEAEIPTFIVHGNHDPVEEGWTAVREWPESVKVFGTAEAEAMPVYRGGTHLATVHGISYARRDTTENLARRFARAEGAPFAVGVLHCNVGGISEHAAYSPCTLEDLAAADMDYWALGHVHRRQVLSDHGPMVAYSGNLQGRNFKASERGAKGTLLVEVDGTRAATTFHAVDVARFDEVLIDIGDLTDLGSLRDRLADMVAELRSQAEGRFMVLRGRLAGRGPLHDELGRTGALEELLESARDVAPAGVVWAHLDDETRPPIDLEQVRARGAGDFTANVLARSDELSEGSDLLEAFAEAALGPHPARLRNIVPPPDTDELRRLLERARDIAVDALEGNGES
jgi:DNA repair exonuclease SbcCD nuclease subunit